jgi:RsiW-degrading membrane proteinase PrsW (M82 family)
MEEWFYGSGGARNGPVSADTMRHLVEVGVITPPTLVWKSGMNEWQPASKVADLPRPSSPRGAKQQPVPERGVLTNIGGKISEVSNLPEIGDVPVAQILLGGLALRTTAEDLDETFAVGTKQTTPTMENIPQGWPRPRAFWRVLGGAIAAYLLLRWGLTEFQNPNFIPGMIVIGSFIVPFSIVVFFLETNLPRNVSVYQVGKMLVLGGTIGLVATMVLTRFVPGSGTGSLVPALLTGALEETAKALALLLIVGNRRYYWQTNGLLFGAAVGAGFAGFESAGYAFMAGMSGQSIFDSIMLRGMLSPGGHVIWTAMIGSAIWKAKGDKPFEFSMLTQPVVVRRWLIAVVLHGLWDTNFVELGMMQYVILCLVGWYITIAILKEALSEIDLARKTTQSRQANLTATANAPTTP